MLGKVFALYIAVLQIVLYAPVVQGQASFVPNPQMWIEAPLQGAQVEQSFEVSGWVFDAGAGQGNGPGINMVRAYSGTTCEGEILAETKSFRPRADVMNAFGLDDTYTNTGFRMTIENIPDGVFTFSVCAFSAVTNASVIQRVQTVSTTGEALTQAHLEVTFPSTDDRIRQVWIHGWAVDPLAGNLAGPGIDLVRVYKGESCEGEVLGEDSFLPWYPTGAGAAYPYLDGSYANRAYTVSLFYPSPGDLTFTICARSTVTGEFEASETRTIYVHPVSWKRVLALLFAVALVPVGLWKLGLLSRLFAAFFIVAELVMGVYWLAFYPGVMTLDGYFQWLQLLGRVHLENSHPYVHTLWMEALNMGTEFFAVTSFMQMTLSALLFAAFAAWLIRHAAPRWIVILGYAILLLLPSTGFYSISMWKDITAAQFVFAFTLGWLMLTIDGVKLSWWGVLGMGLFAGMTFMASVTRHNHLPLLVIAPVLVWVLTQIQWRLKLVYTGVLALLVVAMVIPLRNGTVISTRVSTPEGVVNNTLNSAFSNQFGEIISRYMRGMSFVLYDSRLMYSDPNREYVSVDPIIPALRNPLTRLMAWSDDPPVRYILWNHVPALLMVVVTGMVGLWRRNRSLIGLFLVYGALMGTILILSQRFQNWRYAYFLNYFEFFSVPIVLVCMKYLPEKQKLHRNGLANYPAEAAQSPGD